MKQIVIEKKSNFASGYTPVWVPWAVRRSPVNALCTPADDFNVSPVHLLTVGGGRGNKKLMAHRAIETPF